MDRLVRIILVPVILTLSLAQAMAGLPEGVAFTHDRQAREVSVKAHFPAPLQARDSGGTALVIPGLTNTIEAGLPSVPLCTVKVALPPGTRFTGLEVTEGSVTSTAARVKRSRSMVPYSWRFEDTSQLAPEPAPRIPGNRYPARRATASVQVLHHVPIVVVNLYPVSVSADGEHFTFAADATARVTYEQDPAARKTRALTSDEAARVKALVDNPGDVERPTVGQPRADAYDYLILSSASLIAYAGPGGFKDLTDNLLQRGLKAQVVDVATVARSTAGKDLQDKIRNYIRARYETAGIKYVLLAADGDRSGVGAVIPVRRFNQKIRSYDGTWHTIENEIPADLYYSCLDGDFDGNGNGKFGEPTDGANGGDVDLLAEVAIGRMPMKTPAELKNFVTKTIAFAGVAAPKNVLLMGEELFAQMNLYGDEYMDQLVGPCADHGYQTNGYAPDWTVDRLYDRVQSWSGSAARAKISGGDFSMVHHIGHSNTDYNMRFYSSSIKKFTNPKPFFFYTQGCFPGDFTADACFIELMMRNERAAVAAVANTCYGLGPEDPQPNTTTTPGASQMLHRRFVDALVNGTADTLGRANLVSKEVFLGLASSPEMRWVFWDAEYFGDPALKIAP